MPSSKALMAAYGTRCSRRSAQVRVALGCWRPGYNGASRTRSSHGRRPSNLLPPSAHDGIWRCATRKAPRQIPSQTPPERLNTTQGTNSALDKTSGQRHTTEFAGDRRKLTRTHGSLALAHPFGFMAIINSGSVLGYRIINFIQINSLVIILFVPSLVCVRFNG